MEQQAVEEVVLTHEEVLTAIESARDALLTLHMISDMSDVFSLSDVSAFGEQDIDGNRCAIATFKLRIPLS